MSAARGAPLDKRTAALRRFAGSITAFTIAGAFFLDFEDAWAQPLVALATAYVLEVALESLDAWAKRRPPRYAGGVKAFVDYILPAHITALSIALLLYPGGRMEPIAFAVAVAIGSKFVFQVTIKGAKRHFLNPSNLGIAVVLVTFPAVGVAQPYHFTEGVTDALDWLIPLAVFTAGTTLNIKLTGKGPLIAGWLAGFFAQALLRSAFLGASLAGALLPMTGMAFLIYTNYMITDPGTSPVRPRNQVVFGASTAAVYGLLVTQHVVFGLFFALVIVCAVRGLLHAVLGRVQDPAAMTARAPIREPAVPIRAVPR